jgi:prefoldin alpha subunit
MALSKEDSSDEEKVNALVMEMRLLEDTFNQLTSRQGLLERALIENRAALDALKGMADSKPAEVLLQIGGGALVKAPPPSTNKVLINVGSNVVLEKSREEATAILESRSKDVEKSLIALVNQRNEIGERLDADRQVLQAYLSRQGQKG